MHMCACCLIVIEEDEEIEYTLKDLCKWYFLTDQFNLVNALRIYSI